MSRLNQANRRTVLKAIGAGVAGGVVYTGAASAGRNYGNGNGLGAFLNDEAVLKDQPIWDSGVADKTGRSEADVSVGALTSVDVPEELLPPGEEAPDVAPFAFAPRALKVSPGTEVTWTWVAGHHSVTSYNASADDPADHGQQFDSHGHADDDHTFSYTFEEVGTYLYFCHPHGTPYPVPFGPLGEVPNHVGMRGAVKVSDD